MGALTDIHPSIFEATDRLTSAMMVGGLDGKAARAVGEHQSEWVRTYGAGCGALCTGLTLAVFAATFGVKALDASKPAVLLTFLVACLIAFFVLTAAYMRNKRQMTAVELEKLLPALQLSENQRAYVDTVLALEHTPSMPSEERREIKRHLNELLDEDIRLTSYLEWLGGESSGDLVSERDELRARHDAASDPVAKAAFAQSLELVEARMKAAKAQLAARERAEAQQIMVRQAILSVRDSVSRMGGINPDTPSVNLENLRLTVATVHAQAAAVESAVEEVRALAG